MRTPRIPSRRKRRTQVIASNAFDAISDPTRRAILDGLRGTKDGQSVNQIAARFPVSRPAISRHLRVLRKAALVHERRDGRNRIYTLNAAPLREVDEWLTGYRLHWAATLIALKEFVESEPGNPLGGRASPSTPDSAGDAAPATSHLPQEPNP